MSKEPALIISYTHHVINLECHDGKGVICRNLPDWLVPLVKAYLAKKPISIDQIPSLEELTPFTQSVLRELTRIPFGHTSSYSRLAALLGKPKAYRAVGSACGRNPFPLIIPCHRVVGYQGLGGFSCGLEVKKRLLEYELGTSFASSLAKKGRCHDDRDRDTKENRRTRICA